MKTSSGLALAFVFGFALATGAATARAEGPLSLDDALVLAKKNNRGLVAERAKLSQAQSGVDQAWSALFPTVAAQGKYTHNNRAFAFPDPPVPGQPQLHIQNVDQLDLGVTATAPLLVPAAYPALDAVKATAHAAEAGFAVSEADTMVAVARAFLACAVADEVLAARQSSIDLAKATLKNAETRKAAGTVTKVDVGRAEVAVVRAEQFEREARTGRDQAYRALGTLIGVDGPFEIRPEIPAAPPPSQDVETALHLRPEFRALELAAQSAESQRKARAWQWAPSLSAFGNARYFTYDNFALEHRAWAAGAQLDWMLYDGGTRDAQRHLAAAQAAESRARAEVLREAIRDSLANGQGTLETKRRGVEAAEHGLSISRETLELVRVQYESGVGTQLDLLTAQDSVVAAHLGLAQAHFDVAAADLALRHAAGTFPPK